MLVIFDPETQGVTQPDPWPPYGGWLQAGVLMRRERASIEGAQIEVALAVNGTETSTLHWPEPGTKPKSISIPPERLGEVFPLNVRMQVPWRPQDDVTINVSFSSLRIREIATTFSFQAPRPAPPLDQHGVAWHLPEFWDEAARGWSAPMPRPEVDQEAGERALWADAHDPSAGWVVVPLP